MFLFLVLGNTGFSGKHLNIINGQKEDPGDREDPLSLGWGGVMARPAAVYCALFYNPRDTCHWSPDVFYSGGLNVDLGMFLSKLTPFDFVLFDFHCLWRAFPPF